MHTAIEMYKDRVAIYYHWLNLYNKTANIKYTKLHPVSQWYIEGYPFIST